MPFSSPSGEAKSNEKPYFVMGNSKSAVNLWRWTNSNDLARQDPPASDDAEWARYHVAYDGAAKLESLLAKGRTAIAPLASQDPLQGSLHYENGSYTLLVTRKLVSADATEIQMVQGSFIPMAFWAWDGHNGESDMKASLSAWYYLVLEQPHHFGCLGQYRYLRVVDANSSVLGRLVCQVQKKGGARCCACACRGDGRMKLAVFLLCLGGVAFSADEDDFLQVGDRIWGRRRHV